MTCFPNEELEMLSEIETIVFDMNSIDANCSEISLKKLKHLKKLSLRNSFRKTSRNPRLAIIDGQSGLHINLEDNDIDADSLERLLYDFKYSGIRILELQKQYGHLSRITNATMRGLKETKLTVLNLSQNSLRSLQVGVFQWLQYLEELHISQNVLNHIAANAFVYLHSLKTLSLNDNKLQTFSTGTFNGPQHLQKVPSHAQTTTPVLSKEDRSTTVFNYDIIPNFIFADKKPHKTDFAGTRNQPSQEETFYSENNEPIFTISLFGNNINADSLERLLYDFKYSKIGELSLSSLRLLSTMTDSTLRGLKDTKLKILEIETNLLEGQKNLMKVEILSGRFNCLHCNMKPFIDWMKNDEKAELVLSYPICDIPNQMSIYSLQYGLGCNQAFLISVPIVCVAVFLTVCIVLAFRFRWHIRYVIFLGRLGCGGYKVHIHDDEQPLNKKYHAFVCYNEHNRDWVWQQLVPNLENIDPPNFKLCLHERDFMPGTDIFKNILDSIDNSHKTMLVLSPHFAESEWCYFEMRMAQSCLFDEKRDVLILVLLEEIPDAVMPRVLRKILLTKKYITWVENEAGRRLFWKKLKLDLNRVNRIADL
ncbi:toll-like receptor 13 [Ptychodera flava]|uniref:toll-like receptor 13 n=1 Tax=Ptychodera flava TaxID=63121 RepID=UPI00396A473F